MIYKSGNTYYDIDPKHIHNNYVKIEDGKSVPAKWMDITWPMAVFTLWDCSDVWENL